MASIQKEPERGRDISAPVQHITLEGQTYPLTFSNQCARVAEDVYEKAYKSDKGYGEIITDLTHSKYKAIMAIFYGALVAGGTDMPWEEFDQKFKLDSIPGIGELLMQGIMDALPHPDGKGSDPKDP